MSEKKPTARKPAKKQPTKHPADDSSKCGRPTKYDEKYCAEMVGFFNREPNSPVFTKDEDGNQVVATDKYGNPVFTPCRLPTFEGFAISIGVHRETLLNWAATHPSFFDALKMCKDMQKEILVQNGLVGAYEKTFAIFTAKCVTDMNDKQAETQEEAKPIEIRIVDAVRPSDD